MSKKRVHEIAKEFGVESKQVISILQQHNFNVTKAVNTVDDAGYTVVKNQLGGKSNGADTKAAAAPANPSKHEKAATPNKAVKTDKPAKEQSHKKEAKHGDKKHDDKKSNVRHVQINEPTKKQNNGQKQDGRIQMVINKAKRMMVNKVKKMTTVTIVMQITATAMAV